MRIRHVLFYVLCQFLMLNLCAVLGSTLYLVLPKYVNAILLILLLPIGLSFIVGHIVACRFATGYEVQERFTATNGLVGILAAVAVGMTIHGGGTDTFRSLTLKSVTGVRPEEAVKHGAADYFEFVDAHVAVEHAYERTVESTTTHRMHDGRSRRIRHTETYSVAPVVGPDYERGDPIAVWIVNYAMYSRSERGWSDTTTRGARGAHADDQPVSGVVIRDPNRRSEYEKATEEAQLRHDLQEADRVHYIEYTPDFPANRHRRTRKALIILAVSNLLLVLLPACIYPFAFKE
jgi:hypothetical protein